jgi:glycosyltransferase involved in cell wall biosynthesis
MKIPLSVVIISKNEEKNIRACIESVHNWADEIILVDDLSTDQTREIAKEFTDKIFIREMTIESKQRNFGADQATNDWVLMLDCDERMTPELRDETEDVLSRDPLNKNVAVFGLPRITYLGKHHLKYGGWSAAQARLYHKDYMRWKEIPQDIVHPGITIKKNFKTENLKNSVIHYTYKNVEHFVKKVNYLTTLEAMKWHISSKKLGLGKAMWRTIDRFFRRYIGKKGFKDGYYGFVAAVLSGFYEFITYSKLREIREDGFYLKEYGFKDSAPE